MFKTTASGYYLSKGLFQD